MARPGIVFAKVVFISAPVIWCWLAGLAMLAAADAFTIWVAGGGFKGGVTYGASDEWSYRAIENPIYCYDLHATVLHLLGIDHKRLTYRHNGIDRRLTDVHGRVIEEILA